VRGYSAFDTGLAFLPTSLSLGALSLGVTARLMRRFGASRVLAGGLLLVTAALALFATAGQHDGYFPRLFFAYAMAEVAAVDAGLAAGIGNVSMQVSAAIGLAALGTISTDHSRILAAQGHSRSAALTGGYQLAFTIAAGCVAAGLLVVLVVLRSPRSARHTRPEAEEEARAA